MAPVQIQGIVPAVVGLFAIRSPAESVSGICPAVPPMRNECHRITTRIVRDHDLIAIEDLGIVNMTRSARGTVERLGRNVSAKSGLNRSISEQSWGIIAAQLSYKSGW